LLLIIAAQHARHPAPRERLAPEGDRVTAVWCVATSGQALAVLAAALAVLRFMTSSSFVACRTGMEARFDESD
jgi:hypothetical protein